MVSATRFLPAENGRVAETQQEGLVFLDGPVWNDFPNGSSRLAAGLLDTRIQGIRSQEGQPARPDWDQLKQLRNAMHQSNLERQLEEELAAIKDEDAGEDEELPPPPSAESIEQVLAKLGSSSSIAMLRGEDPPSWSLPGASSRLKARRKHRSSVSETCLLYTSPSPRA